MLEFWLKVKQLGVWLKDRALLPLLAVLVAVAVIVLVSFGLKGAWAKDLLGKLLDGPSKPDPDRKVEPGTPDTKGDTEAVVVPIEVDDGSIVLPDGQPVVLPDGVTPEEVVEVVVVQPQVPEVTVRDTSDNKDIKDILTSIIEKTK